ncbi:unnamed protein product [Orchesella dallaii]
MQMQQQNVPKIQENKSETESPGTNTPKRKKKKISATERRKKREEKFFQALYKNKDSHIQFVSADFIRQFQNPNPGTTPSKVESATDDSILPSALEDTPVSASGAWVGRRPGQELHRLDLHFPSLSPQDRKAINDPGPGRKELEPQPVVPSPSQVNTHVGEFKKVEALYGDVRSSPPVQFTPTPNKKKSQQPMMLDIGSLAFSSKKEEVEAKKIFLNSSGKSGFSKENFKVTAGNPLDSSGPGMINRGKIRLKKKKPSKLKLTIMKSRELRKRFSEEANKQIDENLTIEDEHEVFPNPIQFDETLEIMCDNQNIDATNEEVLEKIKDIKLSKTSSPSCTQETDSHPNYNVGISIQNVIPISNNKKGAKVLDNDNLQNSKTLDVSGSRDEDVDKKFLQLLDEIMLVKVGDKSVVSKTEVAVKELMHSRKFREYCDMYTTKELHGLVMQLLSELYRFQDRLYHTDPIKFKTKRRLVSGLKDATSYLNLNKVQLLIIAPDIEKNAEPGGLDDKVSKILTLAKEKKVPYIFSGNKFILGKQIRIRTPVSIIAVLDKQNCEDLFRKLLDEAERLREKYKVDFLQKVEELKTQEDE